MLAALRHPDTVYHNHASARQERHVTRIKPIFFHRVVFVHAPLLHGICLAVPFITSSRGRKGYSLNTQA